VHGEVLMNDRDIDLVCSMAKDMGNKFKLIMGLIPKNSGATLRQLAASSIHLALFMKDFTDFVNGRKSEEIKELAEFLENCGCNILKKKEDE
jgi:hypothetical protein